MSCIYTAILPRVFSGPTHESTITPIIFIWSSSDIKAMSLYRFSGNQSLANQIVLNDVYSVLFCLGSNDHRMSETAEHHSLKLYLKM